MDTAVTHQYLEGLLTGQPPASTLAWLNRLRAEAVDCVGALTVPTTRDEEWRFTDLSPLIKIPFQPAFSRTRLQLVDIERFVLPEVTARLVFVDGFYAPQLSDTNPYSGVTVQNLATMIASVGTLESHLARHVEFRDNVFAALNTAFLHDGGLIVVSSGAMLAQPVHLLFVATQPVAIYPRCLLIANAHSNVTVIEDYVALVDDAYFSNAVTEIAVADHAHVEHVRVQREAMNAFHIANCAVSLAHTSYYRSVSVAFGARLSRYELSVTQHAEGANCTIDGLALIGGQQLADTHTYIDHARPHGASRQLHKCIAGGMAHAVFNGKILVRPGAQQTNSSQSSRNLLLSGRARVDTKPQLEIFADDVKCAHSATVGQLDDEELFYLKSRGLSDEVAHNLLTYAFGAEIIERIPVAPLRLQLEQAVLARTAVSS